MTAEVLPFKIPKFEKVLDKNNRPIAGYTRHVATGHIYFRKNFRKLGIPTFHISTGETTIGRARTMVDESLQRHKNKHLGISDAHVFGKNRKGGKTFREVALELLETVTPKRRKKTQRKHQDFLKALIEGFGDFDIDSITARQFEAWIGKQKKILSRTTFDDYAKHMNLVIRFGYNEKYCQHLVHFNNPDVPKASIGRVFTSAEIVRLWDVMNETTQDQFVLSYECMMRLREVLHLEWDRVNLMSGTITLGAKHVKTGSKTGKGREFRMSPHALQRMRARHAKRDPRSPFVFPSRIESLRATQPADDNKSAWNTVKSKAKIVGSARWHDLRHTALTVALLVQKRDPLEVSEYAGVSIATIQRVYLHSRAEDTQGIAGAVSIFGKNDVNAV